MPCPCAIEAKSLAKGALSPVKKLYVVVMYSSRGVIWIHVVAVVCFPQAGLGIRLSQAVLFCLAWISRLGTVPRSGARRREQEHIRGLLVQELANALRERAGRGGGSVSQVAH